MKFFVHLRDVSETLDLHESSKHSWCESKTEPQPAMVSCLYGDVRTGEESWPTACIPSHTKEDICRWNDQR
jgi:hypothetical protein